MTEQDGAQNTENQENQFDFGSLNEHFKDSIGETPIDEGSFKNLIENRGKLSEYETTLQQKEQDLQGAMEYKTKYESILDSFNSEKLIPDKEALAISQLSKKHKGLDIGVISKIRSSDLSKMNRLDVLVLADKLKVNANVSDSVRQKEILSNLGIDEEDSDNPERDRYKIDRAFANEVKFLEEIKEFQPENATFDYEAEKKSYDEQKSNERTVLESHNKEALKIIFDGYKETKTIIKDDEGKDIELSYTVDDKFKNNFFNDALSDLVNRGVKITNENAGEIIGQIDQAYRLINNQSIIQDAVKQRTSKLKEEQHQVNNTDSETNKAEAPPTINKENKTLAEAFRTKI